MSQGSGSVQGNLIQFERRASRVLWSNGRTKDETSVDRVLVIGGAGYIGSVLCRKLLADGYSVRVLDALFYGDESLQEVRADRRFELMRGDSRDIAAVGAAMRGVQAIVHLGEIVGDPACSLDEDTTLEINFAATRMVAEIARSQGIRRFSYASSCSVYGASDDLLTETSALNPLSIYARAKIDAERALLGLQNPYLQPLILRLATVYGLSPRPRFDLVVNVLAAKAVVDGQITINGGAQWRPFVHVSDVARLMADCLKRPLTTIGGQVFNVGSNAQNHTIREIGDMVLRCSPKATLNVLDGAGNGDHRNYRVSFTKIESALGFAPRKSVFDGIREVQQAFVGGRIADYRERKYHNAAMLTQDAVADSSAGRPRYGHGPIVVDAGDGRRPIERGYVA